MSFREKMQNQCDSVSSCDYCIIKKECKQATKINLPMYMTDDELKILRTGLLEASKKLAELAMEE